MHHAVAVGPDLRLLLRQQLALLLDDALPVEEGAGGSRVTEDELGCVLGMQTVEDALGRAGECRGGDNIGRLAEPAPQGLEPVGADLAGPHAVCDRREPGPLTRLGGSEAAIARLGAAETPIDLSDLGLTGERRELRRRRIHQRPAQAVDLAGVGLSTAGQCGDERLRVDVPLFLREAGTPEFSPGALIDLCGAARERSIDLVPEIGGRHHKCLHLIGRERAEVGSGMQLRDLGRKGSDCLEHAYHILMVRRGQISNKRSSEWVHPIAPRRDARDATP
jgi:hypothetical protein